MTFAAPLLAGVAALLTLTGCQTFHADLTDEQMTQRVTQRFHQSMQSAEVRRTLRSSGLDELRTWTEDDPQDGVSAGDIGAVIWPKRMFYNGVMSYYARDMLLFRFGGDDALDDVVWRPFNWNKDAGEPLVIELDESEPTP